MNDDLIRRRELLEHLHRKVRSGNDVNIDKEMLEFPAVDAVEVVRCRDCKNWEPSGSEMGDLFENMEPIGGCRYVNFCRKASDFCSYGERRKE